MSFNRFSQPVSHGLWFRLLGLLLGAALSFGLVVVMQLPLLGQPAIIDINASSLDLGMAASPLTWPSEGSAAVLIPSLGIERSWRIHVVPIASLTKMMTAYVVLKALPLALGQSGPCITISENDVQQYEVMKETDQSSVLVSSGESICEFDLLNGLLVHSASNYAVLLADMVAGNVTSFVARMNETAASLGLGGTHYADVSGFSNESVSTALDQGRLAILLMKSPLVRAIVDQSSVTLPVAGTVGSFTPYVGVDDVIGVKSGRTALAGGCDVMAMTFLDGTHTETAYAVVLGQQGGDQLGPAGDAALALAQSATSPEPVNLEKGTVVGSIRWGGHSTNVVLSANAQFSWWSAKGSLRAQVRIEKITRSLHAGQRVGYLYLNAFSQRRISLVTTRSLAPLSLWHRLR